MAGAKNRSHPRRYRLRSLCLFGYFGIFGIITHFCPEKPKTFSGISSLARRKIYMPPLHSRNMFRKVLAILLMAVILAPLFAAPASAAQPSVFSVDHSYSRTVEYHGAVSYDWIVYNGGNTTYLVTITTLTPTDALSKTYTASVSDSFFLISPGQSKTVNLTVSGKDVFAPIDISIDVVFDLASVDSNETLSFTEQTSSHLLPMGGETDSKNKLLGLLVIVSFHSGEINTDEKKLFVDGCVNCIGSRCFSFNNKDDCPRFAGTAW